MHRFLPLALTLLMGLASCEEHSHKDEPTTTAPQAEISASAGAGRIAKRMNAPAGLVVGDHVEERLGDGKLGPSDLRSFTYMKFLPDAIRSWTPSAERLAEGPPYVRPRSMTSWVNKTAFSNLEFYRASPLLGARAGWIGVSRSTGEIYVFTFTS